jgi:hypothetical protein
MPWLITQNLGVTVLCSKIRYVRKYRTNILTEQIFRAGPNNPFSVQELHLCNRMSRNTSQLVWAHYNHLGQYLAHQWPASPAKMRDDSLVFLLEVRKGQETQAQIHQEGIWEGLSWVESQHSLPVEVKNPGILTIRSHQLQAPPIVEAVIVNLVPVALISAV